ncbi:hypothetical protein LIER_18393 [Lithospermum erythrorhizon]|uniref:Uncharacterized protein n=1 Tax=Lithospermum erythrorhizon TaxID=34254 RepID=A0AAV3QDU9_LITER
MRSILPSWGCVHNILGSAVGRIIIAWKPDFCDVEVVTSMDQHVLVEVKVTGGFVILLSIIYGANLYIQRRSLWSYLPVVCTLVKPWLLAGDFSVIRDASLTSAFLILQL